MGRITTIDGVTLHVEDTGQGDPIVFVHEFAGDHRSWAPQVRYFSRRYRCIAYSARGYLPSDVPEDVSAYSQRRVVDDIRDVLDGLRIDKAHVVGLSMGGIATLHFGLTYPARALSLVAAGAGAGSEPDYHARFKREALLTADLIEEKGMQAFAAVYGAAATRQTLADKDPRGFEEFSRQLAEHSAKGSANTMRGYQATRPSLYDFETQFAALDVPTLLVVGDEDDHCVKPSLFLKRIMPTAGLAVLPKTGHAVNLEEQAWFNAIVADFLAQVEHGRWPVRDPSTAGELMRVR
ncbi:alpha/beta fold hydrolase [Microbaculum marinisediminis]|uniref:Alpha/beta hydrolase n=1 Tax=Microbaculum marinisediminis TaxID=2931392 RepID=A0AAW5QX75_9HYPH|nr:alpha/beta hydrolase [Microbaculum sp. A6E488]MCT8970939.1 alpha/beta hydrolase [Microbaculum sp. A6E488]